MVNIRIAYVIIFFVVLSAVFTQPVSASSQQAYGDYQFQFGQYRARSTDYQVALNQYQQFRSLASGQDLLDKTKLLLAQRDTVAKTYFLFLNERLTENPGLLSGELGLYRSLITNQIGFLDQQAVLAPNLGSLDDAQKASQVFDQNYENLQASYRQTIGGIELGYLMYFSKRFDDQIFKAQALIAASKATASPEKQAVMDRWLLALSNKHSLFQQKSNAIRVSIPKVMGDNQEQDRLFTDLQMRINAARQDLVEAASYLKELETALKYE